MISCARAEIRAKVGRLAEAGVEVIKVIDQDEMSQEETGRRDK